jgi:hypothetical protein
MFFIVGWPLLPIVDLPPIMRDLSVILVSFRSVLLIAEKESCKRFDTFAQDGCVPMIRQAPETSTHQNRK